MIYALIALVLGHMYFLVLRKRRRDLLGANLFIDISLLFMICFGAVVSHNYQTDPQQTSLFYLVFLLGTAALYAGLHFPWRLVMPTRDPVAVRKLSEHRMWKASLPILVFWWLLYIGFFAIAIRDDLQHSGSLSIGGLFLGERLTQYGQRLAAGDSFLITTLAYYLLPIPCILLTILWNRGHRYATGLVFVLTTLAMCGEFKTRLWVLMIVTLPLAYRHYFLHRLKWTQMAAVACGALVVLNVLNIWRGFGATRIASDLASRESNAAAIGDMLANDSSPMKALYGLVGMHMTSALDYENGRAYVYVFYSIIPRSLWSGKPLVSFSPRWSILLSGSFLTAAGQANVTTFTAWGEGLAQFGIPGVALNLFLYGLFVSFVCYLFAGRAEYKLTMYCFSIQAAFCLRGEIGAIILFGALWFAVGAVVLKTSTSKQTYRQQIPNGADAYRRPAIGFRSAS
jgi:hypothetical protein